MFFEIVGWLVFVFITLGLSTVSLACFFNPFGKPETLGGIIYGLLAGAAWWGVIAWCPLTVSIASA